MMEKRSGIQPADRAIHGLKPAAAIPWGRTRGKIDVERTRVRDFGGRELVLRELGAGDGRGLAWQVGR